jgi:hypothetical protein
VLITTNNLVIRHVSFFAGYVFHRGLSVLEMIAEGDEKSGHADGPHRMRIEANCSLERIFLHLTK